MVDLEKIKKEVAHDMMWHERNITRQNQRLRLYQRKQGRLVKIYDSGTIKLIRIREAKSHDESRM